MRLFVLALCGFLLVGCSPDDCPPTGPSSTASPPSLSLSLSRDTATLSVGDTLRVTPTTLSNGSPATLAVRFESFTVSVATVEQGSGLVRAVAPGTSRIRVVLVADTTKTASLTVTVRAPAPPVANRLVFSLSSDTLRIGETKDFRQFVSALPSGASLSGLSLSWTTSALSVAGVTTLGVVSAVSAGTSSICVQIGADTASRACVTLVVRASSTSASWVQEIRLSDSFTKQIKVGETISAPVPYVTLRQGAPSGTSTSVRWMSTDTTKVSVDPTTGLARGVALTVSGAPESTLPWRCAVSLADSVFRACQAIRVVP